MKLIFTDSVDSVQLTLFLKLCYKIIERPPSDINNPPQPKIQFPANSAKGIILFSNPSKILIPAFQVITSIDMHKLYRMCLQVMFELLDADYIMFDAFAFYGDSILSQLLNAFISSVKKFLVCLSTCMLQAAKF
jgi:hypothetical protein